jgi:hypothetical protein
MNNDFALGALSHLLLLNRRYSNAIMVIWRAKTIAVAVAYPGRITPNVGA